MLDSTKCQKPKASEGVFRKKPATKVFEGSRSSFSMQHNILF